MLLNSISVPTLEGKNIRLKSWRFLEIGTLEDLAVNVQVAGILYRIAMQSGSINSESNVSSSIVAASCDLSSGSRTNGIEESGCTGPPRSSMDLTEI